MKYKIKVVTYQYLEFEMDKIQRESRLCDPIVSITNYKDLDHFLIVYKREQ